ncbi:Adaptive-response sensory-kinase SasA [Sporomusa silvacetica DSM 10669]|uniref:histidine kinase n=1 Tax=Sporomusa silvacetica DSM 10669 TaxID=1123289 RepID=A0ABZ3IFM6_9FIRM|nr:HAMP domain-containing sensor histidine kinase [Sporomusa silvacetica]OZC17083.1 signal transduction histidine-protein kinase ArlS [Sporomusa silvacetica DSM 10669]
MWSKIKLMQMPISIKLTILYAVILSCILLFTSFLTFTGLLYVLFTQAHDDLRQSVTNVTRYIEQSNSVDSKLLEENLLPQGVILKIYDDQDSLIIDSDTHVHAPTPPWGNHEFENPKFSNHGFHNHEFDNHNFENPKFAAMKNELSQLIDTDHLYFYETKNQISLDGHLFKLHFMKPMLEQNHFLKNLIINLFITNGLGLIIAIISGIFLSNKILRPIRNITEAAKEIEIKNLEKRIPLTDSNDELHQLAKTFNHMLNRIQMGFEKQRRFVSDVSHELRTPITVISGYADMLDRWGKQDPPALQEGIEAIKSEAKNMYGLIEKLLFLARADQNRQILKKTSLNTERLIEEIFQETCIIAPNHKIILTQNEPAHICADSASIKQMLRIFIENSINYTPNGGKIIIDAKKLEHYFEVTVKDSGIGIPGEDQPHVFSRFYRVDKSRSKVTGGTGLGLSIASWIAKQHNSTIKLDSKLGEGTTIIIRIPLHLFNQPETGQRQI